jgi:hypothetical protein
MHIQQFHNEGAGKVAKFQLIVSYSYYYATYAPARTLGLWNR